MGKEEKGVKMVWLVLIAEFERKEKGEEEEEDTFISLMTLNLH